MLECDQIVIPTGHSWGNVVLRYRFHAKAWGEAWERDPSSDVGIDSDGDSGRQEKYATLVQDQGLKVRLLPEPPYPLLTPRSRPRSHVSTSRLPNKRSSQRERADRNMRGIFRIPADASAAAAAGSSSFVLPTVSGALVKMEGGLGCCLYDNCCKCRCGCERKDAGDEAEDVEWECWGGVGVGFADGS